ncbi:hypothetical protein BGP_0530 [Beggiatoa sp. PS]|nr:hypothetical protein BGP_0530 [Beggiatoa sp. PS]
MASSFERKNMKKFLYLLIILGLSTVVLYLLPDKTLQPEVENWLQVEKPISSEQNGFFTLVGLFAAADDDPHTVGVEQIAAVEKAFAQQGSMKDLTLGNYSGQKLAIPDEVKDSLCDVTKTACLENFATQAEAIRQIITDHQVLMDRYQNLYAIKGYQDNLLPATYDTPIPALNPLMRLNLLRVAEIGVEYMTGDKIKAIQSLQQDIEFVRFLLANTSMLLTKNDCQKDAGNRFTSIRSNVRC